ncbi:hypothetical protein [Aeromonas hydrophila]|uniref:hypothetical protein n=1 Tax=Aeromonas hydrophila TaxID=644 RepID=UPI0030159F69
MMTLIRKHQLEMLVLLSTGIGFFISIEVGVLFGLSNKTDSYLTAIALVNFLSLLTQLTWETINIDYIGEKRSVKNTLFSSHLFSTLFTIFLVCISFLFFENKILSLLGLSSVKSGIWFIVLFIFLFCLFTYLKRIAFCEEDVFTFYFSELLYQSFVCMIVLMCYFLELELIVANVIALSLSIAYLFTCIYWKYGLRIARIDLCLIKRGAVGSVKLKVGAFFYSLKDILLPVLLMRYGDGIYTLYNYMSKIFTSLLTVLVLPHVNNFAIESLKNIKNNAKTVFKDANDNSLKYTIKYAISSVFFFIFFVVFAQSIVDVDISFLFLMSTCILLFNMVICYEQFYARLVYNFKMYNYILFVNVLFGSLFYIIIKVSGLSVERCLVMVVFLQVMNCTLYYIKVKGRIASESN